MSEDITAQLQDQLDEASFEKLTKLNNSKLLAFVADAIDLCQPTSVFICTNSDEDLTYVREQAIAQGEERTLTLEGHTIHFDGPGDQARDKANTKYLVPPGMELGANLNATGKAEGLAEVRGLMQGIMQGKTMIVRFCCLGPTQSKFSISGVQITDSFYVAHSEDLLYRRGYDQFARLEDNVDFFKLLHSAGELTNSVSVNISDRRVYIDVEDEAVYSVNTQYAGNTVGFKKLCFRLAIRKANREGWLAEHMFLMGINGPNGRKTYFTGAFPSACGKTSTAMLPGENIVGDDLSYLRKVDGEIRAVNVESGIFGIIRDVNPDDDPLIWQLLTTPGGVIFSNVLLADNQPYWLGDGRQPPKQGENFVGQWTQGQTDQQGNEIPLAHKNARYTVKLADLPNLDEALHDPTGVSLGGIVYGGRDSDTWPPVRQSFDWAHGVITAGASLESETTAAALGKEGVRSFQPMANMDFIAIPLGRYIQSHLDFDDGIANTPPIFAVNYFLKGKDGQYLNGMSDKGVWMKWAELRANGDVDVIETPIGLIPRFEDLQRLFQECQDADYTQSQYDEQFSIRVPENLAKLDRIEEIYRTQVTDTPEVFFEVLNAQRERLQEAQTQHGDRIQPMAFLKSAAS